MAPRMRAHLKRLEGASLQTILSMRQRESERFERQGLPLVPEFQVTGSQKCVGTVPGPVCGRHKFPLGFPPP
jgi:hypothetical protein